MAKYRLAQRSYFDAPVRVEGGAPVAGVMLEPGQVIDFDGIPADHFEPLDKEAKVAREAFDAAVIEGLKPISKEEELDRAAENPLQPPELQRQARELRKQARVKSAA